MFWFYVSFVNTDKFLSPGFTAFVVSGSVLEFWGEIQRGEENNERESSWQRGAVIIIHTI